MQLSGRALAKPEKALAFIPANGNQVQFETVLSSSV